MVQMVLSRLLQRHCAGISKLQRLGTRSMPLVGARRPRHQAQIEVLFRSYPDEDLILHLGQLDGKCILRIKRGAALHRLKIAGVAQRGVGQALITLGERGVYIDSDTFRRIIPAFNAGPVVDTIGAGDAFNGALAVALTAG